MAQHSTAPQIAFASQREVVILAGAHNTIVTARAGKDLVSCLVSGLLTIGPRFGGAVDDSARYFQDACDRGMLLIHSRPCQTIYSLVQQAAVCLLVAWTSLQNIQAVTALWP